MIDTVKLKWEIIVVIIKGIKKRKNKLKGMDISVKNGRTLNTLYFVGDQIVLAPDHDNLEHMARKLIEDHSK